MTSLAVVAVKGGTGKSTVALSLAIELSKQSESVLVIDGDQHVRTTELKMIELDRADPRLKDVLEGSADWKEAVYACCLQKGGEYLFPNLYVLPAGAAFLPDLELGFDVQAFRNRVNKLEEVLGQLERKISYIIIDTPASFSREHLVLLSAADALIPVLTPDDDTYLSTKRKLSELQALLREFQIIGCVLNKVPSNFDEQYWIERAEREIGKVLGIVHFDELAARAFSENLPVQVRYPDARATKELAAIASKIHSLKIKRRSKKIMERIDEALAKLRKMIGGVS
jgi:MinD-like ATPase involved in chromosome partitioning or flagellar assembly